MSNFVSMAELKEWEVLEKKDGCFKHFATSHLPPPPHTHMHT